MTHDGFEKDWSVRFHGAVEIRGDHFVYGCPLISPVFSGGVLARRCSGGISVSHRQLRLSP